MSGKGKKTPLAVRKKVTASARARVSTRKVPKANIINDSSFLQQQPVSTVSTSSPNIPQSQSSIQGHTNEFMFAMLTDIQASNRQLSDRMARLDKQSPSSTKVAASAHAQSSTTQRFSSVPPATGQQFRYSAMYPQTDHHTTSQGHSSPRPIQQQEPHFFSGPIDIPRDAVLPNLESLRRLSKTVSEMVTNILASSDNQVKQDSLQGKASRRSRHYHKYDTVTNPLEKRWPNEGFHGFHGTKKRLLYDNLSMPQWVAG